jgi:4-carboxymuconolactone decarboxylase
MAKDSYEDGMKVRRKMLGDAWVDRSLALRNDFNSEFQEQTTRHVWGISGPVPQSIRRRDGS